MTLAVVYSRANQGLNAPLVRVETHLSNGLPGFAIVGLPEAAVRESKDRVRSALINSHFEMPYKRITINLSPADLPKEGGRFDLPIALGILAASEQIPLTILADYEFAGELALSGELREFKGGLCFALCTKQSGRKLIMPELNAAEASVVGGAFIYGAKHLLAVSKHLCEEQALTLNSANLSPTKTIAYPDLNEVYGQTQAKRALEIAAAGGHSLLLYGPPGSGKSMLASRLPGLLPALNEQEALELAGIHSLAGLAINKHYFYQRPFRAPHHSASNVALVGGGSKPKPGEISLAHHGVLFLDELPEFKRPVLESLREPLESHRVTISRAAHNVEFPACFQFIAAMNPCPCGYLSDKNGRCHCSPQQIQRYLAKISGPILDRIDIHVQVAAVPAASFQNSLQHTQEDTAVVRARVLQCQKVQISRNRCLNARLSNSDLNKLCVLQADDIDFLQTAIEKLKLSMRSYHRCLRLARTIADMASCEVIERQHLSEALSLRQLDRSHFFT